MLKGDGSSDEEEAREEEGEVEGRGEMVGVEGRGEMVEKEGVVSLTDSLSSMTLTSPVCHPDRPSRVSMYQYVDHQTRSWKVICLVMEN